MTKINVGLDNEYALAFALDGKRVEELTRNLSYNIHEMFGFVNPKSTIKCKKIEDFGKPDISIEIDGVVHYVSVKSGKSKSLHQENIFQFCDYLRSLNISEETIDTILYLHFGDGTTDGTGKRRMTYSEVMYRYKDRIAKANLELNKDRDFIRKVIERCIFKGTNPDNIEADYIYNGNATFGVLVSKVQLVKYIMTKSNWNYYTNLHIGPLFFRPHARYVDFKETHPESRFKTDGEWPNLDKDMIFINKRFDG